ncbi:MAG: uracil-DNA glycosylase [Bacilli bacterium]|nr:uracil-DNA glycosylase [Bacilli bacterium]
MKMIGNDWDEVLQDEFHKEYFYKLLKFVQREYKRTTIFPPKSEVFKAFRYTPYKDLKVVILGQDPYHGLGEAEGLSFSVKSGIRKPPSLNNIFKELHDDLGCSIPESGSLVPWAKEGVLLLNAVLTVIKDHAASHKDIGWETFTDAVIKKINEKDTPVVFILWGSFARSKKKLITNPKHFVVESAHPSPLSAYNGFFGSRPFSKTNNFLIKNNLKPINWEIKE